MTANPVQPIPSLPSYIISHLETSSLEREIALPSVSNTILNRKNQESAFPRLPVELVEEIASYLDIESVFALRLTCIHLASSISLSQKFWFKRFLAGELFGFFPSFDSQDVINEIKVKCLKRNLSPPQWDWMALIKQLSQYSSFKTDGKFHDAPAGFRNRRRIWKILEMVEQYHNDQDTISNGRSAS